MKFTLSWLKEHLDTEASVDEISVALTALGLEVEEVTDRSTELAPFTVAKVTKAEKHPDADRLQVCTLDTKDGEIQVVCGAPNARAGMTGVYAPVGAFIPGLDVTLKKGKIRGVESMGMLVSEREMGISDEHTGIIDLGDIAAEIGTPFAPLMGLDDPLIEIGLTPDRADCAGIRGIARDLAAAGLGTLRALPVPEIQAKFDSPVDVHFDFPEEAQNACSIFAGRVIRGVKNGPSPQWLQDKLTSVGLRPISTLVDITNFFTMDRARPLHVFDVGKMQGDLRLSLSKGGETLDALNDKSYTMPEGLTVIGDDSGVVSLAGVVGGTGTGCDEQTVDVFLEAALFDPIRTATAGRELEVLSDARYRFERGVDPESVLSGIDQATWMILDLCGGEASERVVTGAVPQWRREITLRYGRVAGLGGLDVAPAEQRRILEALGFEILRSDDEGLTAVPPSWRGDVHGEPDLVEEVLRVVGLDQVPSTPLPRDTVVAKKAVSDGFTAKARAVRTLASRGMEESVTWSFMKSDLAKHFGQDDPELTLVNPIAADLDAMRPSILANLAQAAGRNAARGYADVALFEGGPVWTSADPEKGQRPVVAGLRAGAAVPRGWTGGARSVDLYDAKADALAALAAAGAPADNLQATPDAPGWYHPGRSGVLRLGAMVLAHFGELHPETLKILDVDGPMVGFEVFLDQVRPPRKKGTARPNLKLAGLQPVNRDFAFLVADDVPADKLPRAIRGADKQLITDAGVFDVYQGKGVPEGQKSVAVYVTLQPTEKTLTDDDIEAVGAKIVAAVQKQTGGTLRG